MVMVRRGQRGDGWGAMGVDLVRLCSQGGAESCHGKTGWRNDLCQGARLGKIHNGEGNTTDTWGLPGSDSGVTESRLEGGE
jgi:hypothetical protein